jgi:RHS repeat-associated protein
MALRKTAGTFLASASGAVRPAIASLTLLAAVASSQALAQGFHVPNRVDMRYEKLRDSAGRNLATPGNQFGEQISLENGDLNFNVVDVSIPGNSTLPVEFRRAMRATEPFARTGQPNTVLADWRIALPRIEASYDIVSGWSTTDPSRPTKNCSISDKTYIGSPPAVWYPNSFPLHTFWNPPKLHWADGSSRLLVYNEGLMPQPATGGRYYWLTSGMDYVSCLPALKNAGGLTNEELLFGRSEGYVVLTPQGHKYYFDWIALEKKTDAFSSVPVYGYGGGWTPSYSTAPVYLNQVTLAIYPTRVEDRFGNWVEFTYSNKSNEKISLTKIESNDGRRIDIVYDTGRISEVRSNGRVWRYTYRNPSSSRDTVLAEVRNPDQSAWQYPFDSHPVLDATIDRLYGSCGGAGNWRNTQNPDATAGAIVGGSTYAVISPSGARADFTLSRIMHGRSGVQGGCYTSGWTTEATGTPSTISEPVNYLGGWKFAVTQKKISGSGMADRVWKYHYQADIGLIWHTSGGTARTKILEPDGTLERHTYGNVHLLNEGLLLKVEKHEGGVVVSSSDHGYIVERNGATFPKRIGHHPYAESNEYAGVYLRPKTIATTLQTGDSFSWQVPSTCEASGTAPCFDAFARPLRTRSYSSLGYSRTDVNEYHDDPNLWVLGQIRRITNSDTGMAVGEVQYNAQALPERIHRFGKLDQAFTYWSDGQIRTVADGRGNLVTLSDYHRGIPRLIQHPPTPEAPAGATQSATVENNGWITSITDENGFVTGYGYDAMGRLASTVHPTGDSLSGGAGAYHTAWTDFRALTDADWKPAGVSSGQWREVKGTGDHITVTYMNALWQPILVHEYDQTNVAPTLRATRTDYDTSGRISFRSYPSADTNPGATGTRTYYDALDRVIRVEQDSELGVLATTTQYLSGLRTRITNPRGQQITTHFLAWDQPSLDRPILSEQPEGKVVQIDRHPQFGWPLTLTQRNAANTQSATRRYVYDGHGQLCKTIEPETGATVMGYDAAGNLSWSAAGLYGSQYDSTTDCQHAAAYASGRTSTRSHDARNRLTNLNFPDGRGNQAWTYTPDSLPASITTWNGQGNTEPVLMAYSYNRRRLLTGESITQYNGATPWYTWTIGYAYNAYGHLASQTYPTGLVVDYAPNPLGQATRAGAYASGAQYYPNGALKQFTYGNGIVHTMQQNARQLPSRVTSSGGVNDFTYSYDANANVTNISDQARGDHYSRWLSYDNLDRLTAVGSGHFGGDSWHRMTYDALDNLKSWKLAGVKDYAEYVYDAQNRLTNIRNTAGATVVGLDYDQQGNLFNKNGQIHNFDYGNRLRSVSGKETYRYDGLGRRVQTTSTNGKTTLWQYSQSGQMLFSSDWGGPDNQAQQTHENVYLAGSLIATIDRAWPSNAVLATKYQHTDALGSPVAVTNASGQLIERMDYEPWGAIIGNPARSGMGYTGHVMDGATGLTYMQQRYYDQSIGRFLSMDPMAADTVNGWNFNRYNYAANNPYKFKDPDGRAIETGWDVANIVMGVASFTKNVASGNYAGAAVDAVGVVVDTAAAVVPGVPGGAGATIKTVRATNTAVDASRSGNRAANIPKPPTGRGAVPPSQRDPKRVVSNAEKREILNNQGGNCAQCGKPTTTEGSAAHHVQRHADGGPTTRENTAVVCNPCHVDLHRREKP